MKKTIINSMTIKRKKVINEGKTFAQAMGKRKLATNASSIAFYIFISLIPMLVLICSELPFTGISKRELTSAVTKITPQMVHGLISSMISQAYSSRIGVFSVSIILLIWSSSKGMLALIRSLDIVYEVQDSRNYITMVFFSIFCTMCLLLGASVLLVIYTKELSAEEILRATHLSTDKAAPFSKSAAKVRKNVKTTKLLTIKSEILHHQHSYAAPSALIRCTVSTLTLHRQYSYAAPSEETRNTINRKTK